MQSDCAANVQFAAYCAYRGRLESAFLAAELASAAAAETRPGLVNGVSVASAWPSEASKGRRASSLQCVCSLNLLPASEHGNAPGGGSEGGEEKSELSRSAQSMPSPRLGVSWTSDRALRGVGSELSPAIAALVMTPHSNGDNADVEEASPRLSGLLLSSLQSLPDV